MVEASVAIAVLAKAAVAVQHNPLVVVEGVEDWVATATELTAVTVPDAIQRFVLRRTAIDRLIVSGGGAHNRFLMKRFGELLPGVRVRRSREFGIPEDAKEAVTFALLADRTLAGLPGNLPAVTGARPGHRHLPALPERISSWSTLQTCPIVARHPSRTMRTSVLGSFSVIIPDSLATTCTAVPAERAS